MPEIVETIRGLTLLSTLRIIEFVVVWYVIYRLLLLIRGTKAWPIMLGLLTFSLAYPLSDYLNLYTLHYLLEKVSVVGGVALVVLFFPELRQALEQFGNFSPWTQSRIWTLSTAGSQTIEEVVEAVAEMAADRIGALVVLEKTSQLQDVVMTGIRMDSQVTAELITSVFFGRNPLHDGAIVIRGDRILAAACQLPMTTSNAHPDYHMRHRAALGVTENSDALSIVVSEETGRISIAMNGRLYTNLSAEDVRNYLNDYLHPEKAAAKLKTRIRAARIKRMKKETKGELPQA